MSVSPDTGQHRRWSRPDSARPPCRSRVPAGTPAGASFESFSVMTFQSRNARGLVSAFLPSCLLAGAVAAQAQSAPMLSPVVVTASGTEQKLQDALPATTLITQDDIARAHASDLPTLLGAVAGVQLAQAGGIGSPTSAFLRGGNSNDTLARSHGSASRARSARMG